MSRLGRDRLESLRARRSPEPSRNNRSPAYRHDADHRSRPRSQRSMRQSQQELRFILTVQRLPTQASGTVLMPYTASKTTRKMPVDRTRAISSAWPSMPMDRAPTPMICAKCRLHDEPNANDHFVVNHHEYNSYGSKRSRVPASKRFGMPFDFRPFVLAFS